MKRGIYWKHTRTAIGGMATGIGLTLATTSNIITGAVLAVIGAL